MQKKQFFVDGLSLLADNIKLIDYHQVTSRYAIQQSKVAAPVYSELKQIPEYMEWREFRSALVDELRAAVSMGRDYDIELRSCSRLGIALCDGFFQEQSPLVFDAIVEIREAIDTLAETLCDVSELPLSTENRRLLQAMLSFGVDKAISFQELIKKDELAFRGDVSLPSVASRLKVLRKKLPRAKYEFVVHENDYEFTWKKRPIS